MIRNLRRFAGAMPSFAACKAAAVDSAEISNAVAVLKQIVDA